jgi:hypothetical protein
MRPLPRKSLLPTAALLVVLGLVMSVLASCSGVPSSGPVHVGPVVDSGENSQFIRVIAAPPSPGASPEQIVRGFLEANASQQDDWAIARRYLTSSAATNWRPARSTLVYDASGLKVTGGQSSVRVQLPVVAKLSGEGTLEVVEPRDVRVLTFHLRKVPGGPSGPEWRVADPQRAIMISQSDLRRSYRLYQAYFMSNRAASLVPDARMLPVVGPSLPTALVDLVLAGPAGWLRPAVHSGATHGLALALGAVPVTNAVAVVDLNREALLATQNQRRELAAQLTWTLTQLPGVSQVRLTVESQPYDVSGSPVLMDRGTWAARSPDAAVIAALIDGSAPFYTTSGLSLTRVDAAGRTTTTLPLPKGTRPSELAISLDQGTAAAVMAGGRAVWFLPLGGGQQVRSLTGKRITSVSYDMDGTAWFCDSGRLWRVAPDGQPAEVTLPEPLPGGGLESVRLAHDGARIALVIGSRLYVAAVVAEPSAEHEGVALRLGQPRLVARGLSAVADAAWRDSASLEVLAASRAGSPTVAQVSLGDGVVATNGTPSHAVSLTAAPSSASLVVTSKGRYFTGVGLQWRDSGAADLVVYPG